MDVSTACLIDGVATTRLPVTDRALRYGDGLFETIGVFGGRVPLWALHMARLQRDAQNLGLPRPSAARLEADCARLIEGHPDCCLRITWTRGDGGMAYVPPVAATPRRVVERIALPADIDTQQRHGITAMVAEIRLASQPRLAGIKHLNRLEQVLAAQECSVAGVDEAVLLDQAGRLAESVAGNLVLVHEQRLLTPCQHAVGVAGVGLQWLTGVCPEIRETPLTIDDLQRADEIMVINSVRGVRPIVRLDRRDLTPGVYVRRLQALWQELIARGRP